MSKWLLPLCLVALLPAPGFAQQKFENLRFDEDWSFLSAPDATTNHFFPGLKYVELGDGWFASFGGQERLRFQDEQNRALNGSRPLRNDFFLNRARLHADIRNESGFRVFVEMIDARIYGESRPPTPIDRNTFDVHNAFAEYRAGDTTLRAGRFELQYGSQRFVSPLDWGNTRRRFEGVLARQEYDGATIDLFLTKFVEVDPHDHDSDDDSLHFSGLYGALPLADNEGVDAYLLALNEHSDKITGSDRVAGQDVYTAGVRHWRNEGAFQWEGELAQQFGNRGGDTVRATAANVRLGWLEKDLPGSPRFGLDVDWASGDDDPTDSTYGTFNQLFPLGHAYFGYLDLVGRQNILDIQPNVTVKLDERTDLRAEYHVFRLDERRDALYNAGGAPTLRDPTGAAGTDVGDEIDVYLAHRPAFLGPHGHVLVGYSYFTPGEFVQEVGSSKHAELYYVQLTFTF